MLRSRVKVQGLRGKVSGIKDVTVGAFKELFILLFTESLTTFYQL